MTPSRSILFVAPRFHTNLFFATKALVEAGHRVSVFAEHSQTLEDHSLVVPQVFPRGTRFAAVKKAVREVRPDLVLLRRTRPASFHVERLGRFGRLNIWHYDQKPMTQHRPRKELWSWWLQGLPARRVTPKPGLDRTLPPEPRAVYLPWPVARDPAVPLIPRDGPLRVLCVGKLMQPRKNQDKLVEATHAAVRDGRIRLTLAGGTGSRATGADLAHLERLREEAGASDGIKILEDVPFADMARLYARHDVCVLPARSEPLGTAPIEAMVYGCVPVLTDQCGSAGYLTDGVDGFIVSAGDLAQLRTVLDGLAGDAALAAKIGNAARHLAETELSPERFVARIAPLFETSRDGER